MNGTSLGGVAICVGVGIESGAQAASVNQSANASSASFTGLNAAPAVTRDQAS